MGTSSTGPGAADYVTLLFEGTCDDIRKLECRLESPDSRTHRPIYSLLPESKEQGQTGQSWAPRPPARGGGHPPNVQGIITWICTCIAV